jgi:hypothetical protein
MPHIQYHLKSFFPGTHTLFCKGCVSGCAFCGSNYTSFVTILSVALVVLVVLAVLVVVVVRPATSFAIQANRKSYFVGIPSFLTSTYYPLKMSSFTSESLISNRLTKQINGWCGLHGLMYTDGNITWTPAPLSLLPNIFPKSSFEYAKSIQTTWNKLVDRISRDRDFVVNELRSVSEADEFTLRLLRLYEAIPAEVLQDAVQFGIFRSDYMVNHDRRALQVEINTIASSFGSLSQKVSLFHKHLLDRNMDDLEFSTLVKQVTSSASMSADELRNAIVDNHSMENIAAAIAAAHSVFGKKEAVVLFIVQPNERNVSTWVS